MGGAPNSVAGAAPADAALKRGSSTSPRPSSSSSFSAFMRERTPNPNLMNGIVHCGANTPFAIPVLVQAPAVIENIVLSLPPPPPLAASITMTTTVASSATVDPVVGATAQENALNDSGVMELQSPGEIS